MLFVKNKLKIILEELRPNMVSEKYLMWLNSKEIVKFTEQRFIKHSKKKIINFVRSKKNSKNEFLYGIFIKMNSKKIHIGNIKLGPICYNHKNAKISYLIGEKNLQNEGLGTKAIKEMLYIAKKRFKLKKIIAGTYSNNFSSQKVLLKNGFKLEGNLKKYFLYKKKRIDRLIFGKVL